MIACESSDNDVNYCFPEVRKSIISSKIDYNLTKYACYLIAQSVNFRKAVVI